MKMDKRIKKHGQMKIQQMAFMLMAVTIFFVLVGLFWLAVQYRQIHEEATRLEQEKAMLTSSFIGASAEFTCGEYCVDEDKLVVLKERQAYKNFWPFAYIEVRKVSQENKVECTKGNYPNCNVYTIYDKGKTSTREAESFVALCRKEQGKLGIYEKCELGKIIIGYEVK